MSDIYLTKIERKTIFTRSLIFVLLTFLICDLTVTGPFYFNFIPWIYLIGITGEIKKIDKVIMGVISTFTVFVSTVIINGAFNINCIINTFVSIILLVFGIITGKIINEFVLEHRLVKYIKPSKKVIYILGIVLLTVVSFGIVGVKDGNLFEYVSSRNKLNNYIKNTYSITDYKIKKVQYDRKLSTKYSFLVEIEGQVVDFVPIDKTRYKDANMEERLNNANYEIQVEFNKKINEIDTHKYIYIQDIKTWIEVEYSKPSILPDSKIVYISLNGVDYSKENEEEIYYEIADYIKKVVSIEDVDKIMLELDDNSMEISKDKFNDVTYKFLQGGFIIEELDGSWG